MSRYEGEIDLDNPNNSQTELVKMVGTGKSVLDVGCAAGDAARALQALDCRVWGLDIDAESAEAARPYLEDLVIADLDRTPLTEHYEAASFDAIIFGDVLEHLRDPVAALADAAALLTPGGRVMVSVPNVSHGAVRLALLQGRWRYTETGLLDATHVYFFTRANFLELFEDAGFVLEELRATVLDPFQTEVDIDPSTLPPTIVEWVRHQPDALYYQFLGAARVRADGELAAPVPEMLPALPEQTGRLDDEYTEEMRAAQAEQHRQLTLRDHIIGLEASLAVAAHQVGKAEARATKAERQTDELRRRLRLERKEAAAQRTASVTRQAARQAVRKLADPLRARRSKP